MRPGCRLRAKRLARLEGNGLIEVFSAKPASWLPYLIAWGFIGEATPPVIGNGGATNMNS
jgi:hypothetical protein